MTTLIFPQIHPKKCKNLLCLLTWKWIGILSLLVTPCMWQLLLLGSRQFVA